ncbi:MAG TPA: hypothetical protein VGE56_02155 [Rhodocyclaceae bacterium]
MRALLLAAAAWLLALCAQAAPRCELRQVLRLNASDEVTLCGAEVRLRNGKSQRSLTFAAGVDQVFLLPEHLGFGIRRGEQLGLLRGQDIVPLSTMSGLRQLLPLADRSVVALVAQPGESKLLYLKSASNAAELWKSPRTLLDAARTGETTVAVLSNDGLVEMVELRTAKPFKTFVVAAGTDRIFADIEKRSLVAVQRKARLLQRCDLAGGRCAKPERFDELGFVVDAAGKTYLE